jgi:hypothetical protein
MSLCWRWHTSIWLKKKTSSVVWNSSSTTLGQGSSLSKTECFFFPPPQFFSTIAVPWYHHHNAWHTYLYSPTPTRKATCTKHDLPDGLFYWLSRCNCIIPPTTFRQRRNGTMKIEKEICTNIIHVLPKSLSAFHLNGWWQINSADNDNKHNPGQTEHEHDQLIETQDFYIADGFLVSFTWTFWYLGSLISYNLTY